MINFLKCIAGFAFLTIQLKENFILTAVISDCIVESDIANCSNKNITRIPQDLGENIKILDISNIHEINKNFTLHKDDLKNYGNLNGFVMKHYIFRNESFPEGFFKYTKHLKMLNISGTSMIANFTQIPDTIEIFNFTRCYQKTSFDISHLNRLREVYLNECRQLRHFPNISKTAPLQIVDMRMCSLSEFRYCDIAAFCHLRVFLIQSVDLKVPKFAKQCCELHKWGNIWNIRGLGQQVCFKNKLFPKCSSFHISISDKCIEEYRICFKKAGIQKFISFLVVFAVTIILLIILTVAFLFFVHINRSKNQNKKKGSIKGASEAEANITKKIDKDESETEATTRKESFKGGSETEANTGKGSVRGGSETEYGIEEQ